MEENNFHNSSNPFGGPGASPSSWQSATGFAIAQPINSFFLSSNTSKPPPRYNGGISQPISTFKRGYDLFDDDSDEDAKVNFAPPASNSSQGPSSSINWSETSRNHGAGATSSSGATQRIPAIQNQVFLGTWACIRILVHKFLFA
jgi:hypothetical protein